MSDPALLSLRDVAAQIRDRKLSSVEVTQALLARVEKWQPKLNAFVRIEQLQPPRNGYRCCQRGGQPLLCR